MVVVVGSSVVDFFFDRRSCSLYKPKMNEKLELFPLTRLESRYSKQLLHRLIKTDNTWLLLSSSKRPEEKNL